MIDTKQPSEKDKSETKKPSDNIIEFVKKLRDNVKSHDEESVKPWKDKMRIARNMRQGIKRLTDFPYPGAPDIPLPETDKIIRKHKPRFVLSVISGKRLMDVKPLQGTQEITPEMEMSAKKAAIAMNWLFRRPQMEWVKKLTLSADRFLEKGFCIFKIIEHFDSRHVNKSVNIEEFTDEQLEAFRQLPDADKEELLSDRFGLDPDNEEDAKTLKRIISEFKAGKKNIDFVTEAVMNLPDVSIPMPEKVFVPKGTTEIERAARITNEFWWSERELTQLAHKNILLKDKVLKVLKDRCNSLNKEDDDINEKHKDMIEGIDNDGRLSSVELFRIHETVTWYQPEEGKPFERWVFVTFADISDPEEALIQWMPYPFEFAGWNYVKHDNEIIDDRYRSSRGIPEQIRAIQEFMEKSMNNMLVRDEINNAPMYTVKTTANLISDNVQFIPGQRINVNNHDDIQQLSQASNVDVSSSTILTTLKAYAEEYVGISDQLFKNASNNSSSKTLGEIQAGIAETQFAVNLDILNWIESVRKVYEKVFFVMRERLIHPLVINGTIITREDFQFEPDITVNGSLELADKALQQQRAQLRLERCRQAVGDGVANHDDLFNAYKDYLEKDGVKEPDDYITDPKIIAQTKIHQMTNQIMQLQTLLADVQAEIAQADNTLRQIDTQIIRKGGPTPAQRKEGSNGQRQLPQVN